MTDTTEPLELATIQNPKMAVPKQNRHQRRAHEARFRTAKRRANQQVFQKIERKVDQLLAAGKSLEEVERQLADALKVDQTVPVDG